MDRHRFDADPDSDPNFYLAAGVPIRYRNDIKTMPIQMRIAQYLHMLENGGGGGGIYFNSLQSFLSPIKSKLA